MKSRTAKFTLFAWVIIMAALMISNFSLPSIVCADDYSIKAYKYSKKVPKYSKKDHKYSKKVPKFSMKGKRWVGTWSASPAGPGQQFEDQTLRQIAHISIGGDWLRIRLSNSFGTEPLVIDAASIGIQDAGDAVVPGSLRTVTFSDNSFVTIPAGGRVLSDPVQLTVDDNENLAVNLYILNPSFSTKHTISMQTTYISPTFSGNQTDVEDMEDGGTTVEWYWLSGVEVLAHHKTRAVVTLGDSITDKGGDFDENSRYPDFLARRLLDKYPGSKKVAVLNAGLGGNRVLNNKLSHIGVNALARLDRDVLTQSGVSHVILLEGINDIFDSGLGVTADDIIDGYKQIIARVHAMGLKIALGTLTPFKGSVHYSDDRDAKRGVINEWIRTSDLHDGVVDFDQAVRDPADPLQILPEYTLDNLNFTDDGYKAMADAVNLRLLR